MSEQRVTVGVVAKLVFPVGKYDSEEHMALEEKLDFMNSKLKICYDGAMILYIYQETPVYDAGLFLFGDDDNNDHIYRAFNQEVKLANIEVDHRYKKLFVDNWYDGSDRPHQMLTLKKAGFFE